MADLFAISNAVIDGGKTVAEVGPINRVNHQLPELGDTANESTARMKME